VLVTARKLNALDESKVLPPASTIDARAQQLTAVELELGADGANETDAAAS
jgi:DNA recombination protein RmuC